MRRFKYNAIAALWMVRQMWRENSLKIILSAILLALFFMAV